MNATRLGTRFRPDPTPAVLAWRSRGPIRRHLSGKPYGAMAGLAEQIGVTKARLFNWAQGMGKPTAHDMLRRLCRAVGVSVDGYLAWYDEFPQEAVQCEAASR